MAGDPGAGLGGRLVRVHLVAEEEENVRTLGLRVGGEPGGEGVEDIGAHRIGLAHSRRRPPARAEGDHRARRRDRRRVDGAGRLGRVREGPHPLAVEQHLVRCGGPRGESGHDHQRVVVADDAERGSRTTAAARAPDLRRARPVGLDPHRRARARLPVHVSQEWAQPQTGHRESPSGAPHGTERPLCTVGGRKVLPAVGRACPSGLSSV